MPYFFRNFNLKQKTTKKLFILFLVIAGLSFNIDFSIPGYEQNSNTNTQLMTSATSPMLFEGIESSLNITDYGNLYKSGQNVDVSNQEAVNLTYYLDDVHDWEVSKVSTEITNIQDTREWVNNSDFLPVITFKVYETHESGHDYLQNRDESSTLDTISQTGAIAMRAHFTELSYEDRYDFFFIEDENDAVQFTHTGESYLDLYSPWIRGSELNCYYESDNSVQYYGYQIDFYEFVNSSSNYDINSFSWEFNSVASTETNYGASLAGNSSAMFTSLNGDISYDAARDSTTYFEGDFAELSQNIVIPRGQVIDAYISFNYYAEYAMDSNENYIYCKINNKKIYSKGLGEINDFGKHKWLSTGSINFDLWSNTSNIFEGILSDNTFNISVGIMSGATITYSGFEDQYQQVFWYDNVSLILTTLANASQTDINLQLDKTLLNQGTGWGLAYLNLTGSWNTNPVILSVSTDSPSLSFNLDTTLYGYHDTESRVGQTTLNGLSYDILENGTIIWEFAHNFYMPAQYSDFEFTIYKPENWNFISVLDPTLLSRPYTGGGEGETTLHINKENALFPGWWTFQATSPNYLSLTNTKLLNQGPFITGESTRIKTQINNSNDIPLNVDSTLVNLTVYDSEGEQWFTETNSPLSNGTVIFSELTFGPLNTTGGTYEYTLFWSNGTSLGGIKSDFIVEHQSTLTLLKPDDAKVDYLTEGFVGDIIPVRVFLTDSENNFTISNSMVSYNWTLGRTFNFTEAALGVYEAILDTADLASRGLYSIVISSSKVGFLESNVTLEINLGEETKLQRLESEYNIELHANSTIKFKFMDFDNDGIDGALVNVSISNPDHYEITNVGSGVYDIDFNTVYIPNVGVYQINFSFSATGYEPQYYTYQFQVIEQSVILSVFRDSIELIENSLIEATYYDLLNISARAMSHIDQTYISGGNFTWISDVHQHNLTEAINYWYNSSIDCLPDNFEFGINYVYLQFEHQNYRTQTFGFQLLVNQVEFNVDILGFDDTIDIDVGASLSFQIELIDPVTSDPIENATVTYIWDYGVGELSEISNGIYQLTLNLPENLQGNFNFKLIASKTSSVFKTTEFSFLLTIGEPGFPIWIIWLIIGLASAIIATLGILSLRSYVILPMKRRKEAKLLTRTQRFKDLENIQAIVVMHKLSGIPLYSKSYSILEKQKKELFSGFIQAIATIGEEIVGKDILEAQDTDTHDEDKTRKILELDFKYFYCLICDRQDLRIVFVLSEHASDRIKTQISDLSLGLNLQLSQEIENWDGSIDKFDTLMPPIINKYIELYFKEPFILNNPAYIADMKKAVEFSSMENRVLNVIYSMAKNKQNFYLGYIIDTIHETNKDLVIDAIENLIQNLIILPVKNNQ